VSPHIPTEAPPLDPVWRLPIPFSEALAFAPNIHALFCIYTGGVLLGEGQRHSEPPPHQLGGLGSTVSSPSLVRTETRSQLTHFCAWKIPGDKFRHTAEVGGEFRSPLTPPGYAVAIYKYSRASTVSCRIVSYARCLWHELCCRSYIKRLRIPAAVTAPLRVLYRVQLTFYN